MSRQIQIRRGTATENNNFTGAIGEVTMDTTNKTLRVHDGSTQGGNEIVSKNQFYSYITNCITEIPQDVKLELNNGTLILKSGSKVYIPNGASNFDIITIANDMSITPNYGTQSNIFVFLNSAHTGLTLEGGSHCYSGDNMPTLTGITYANWYDTANNIMKRTTNGGNSWLTSLSLPIAIITSTSNVVTSIDRVFNGFGYIGSTVFALPGVKGLIPNGRNPDGTLRNSKVLNTTIRVYTATSAFNGVIGMNSSGEITCYTNLVYDSEGNYNYQSGARYGRFNSGEVVFGTNGKVSSFSPKKVFNFSLS